MSDFVAPKSVVYLTEIRRSLSLRLSYVRGKPRSIWPPSAFHFWKFSVKNSGICGFDFPSAFAEVGSHEADRLLRISRRWWRSLGSELQLIQKNGPFEKLAYFTGSVFCFSLPVLLFLFRFPPPWRYNFGGRLAAVWLLGYVRLLSIPWTISLTIVRLLPFSLNHASDYCPHVAVLPEPCLWLLSACCPSHEPSLWILSACSAYHSPCLLVQLLRRANFRPPALFTSPLFVNPNNLYKL